MPSQLWCSAISRRKHELTDVAYLVVGHSLGQKVLLGLGQDATKIHSSSLLQLGHPSSDGGLSTAHPIAKITGISGTSDCGRSDNARGRYCLRVIRKIPQEALKV